MLIVMSLQKPNDRSLPQAVPILITADPKLAYDAARDQFSQDSSNSDIITEVHIFSLIENEQRVALFTGENYLLYSKWRKADSLHEFGEKVSPHFMKLLQGLLNPG